LPISVDDSPSRATARLVDSAAATAFDATLAASLAFWAISRMDMPISSAPAATVCTLRDTCSAAAATRLAWPLASQVPAAICALTLVSVSDDDASAVAVSSIIRTVVRMLPIARLTALAMVPTSSREDTATSAPRSPSATAPSASETRCNGRTTSAVAHRPTPNDSTRPATTAARISSRLRR
jgi:hypothetical protein